MADPAHCRGDLVFAARWLALADVAAVLPSGFDRAALVLPLARQRVVADNQPHPTDGDMRGARP